MPVTSCMIHRAAPTAVSFILSPVRMEALVKPTSASAVPLRVTTEAARVHVPSIPSASESSGLISRSAPASAPIYMIVKVQPGTVDASGSVIVAVSIPAVTVVILPQSTEVRVSTPVTALTAPDVRPPVVVSNPLTTALLVTTVFPVAVRVISPPDVTVRSVLSPSIFSPVPKVTPTLAGTTTSVTAVKLIAPQDVTVRSVSLPSIFSPAPKVTRTLRGTTTSVTAVKLIAPPDVTVRSVLSPSIFSPVPKVTPTLRGTTTSVTAVKLIAPPDVTVRSVLSPSIFSPVPKVTPTLAGTTTSVVAVKLIAPPDVTVRSVLSPS